VKDGFTHIFLFQGLRKKNNQQFASLLLKAQGL